MIRRVSLQRFFTLVAAVLIFCTAFAFLCPVGDGTAFAASLPASYTDVVGETGDWYFSQEYLSVAETSERIFALRAECDFSVFADDPVVIAVIDTGVNADNDLFGSADDGTDVFLRDETGEVVGYNAINGATGLDAVSDGATKDYHGTHTTGIVALLIRALGLEDCIKIMPIKAGENTGSGNRFSVNDVKDAISFALNNGADVVNLSLGISESTSGSASWKEAVTESDSERAVFVAAAGNSADSSDYDAFYPAASPNVIGVMSYIAGESGAELYLKSSTTGSNYGSLYEVCAPGVDIVSANGNPHRQPSDDYKTLTGTSMASPMTAFGVALLALRCRAEGEAVDAEQLREMFLLTFTDAMEFQGEEYALLSLVGVLDADFAFDSQQNAYLSSARYDAVAFSVPSLTLGRDRQVTLYADSRYLNTGAEYKWSFSVNGVKMSAQGQRVRLNLDIFEKKDIEVTMTVYAPDGQVLASRIGVLGTEYLVPTAANSSVTLSLRKGDDGSVYLAEGKSLVLGVDTLRYADPASEVIWYVDGREAERTQYFSFSAEKSGTYLITVTVNGERIGEAVKVVAEGSASNGLSREAVIGISVAAGAVAAGGISAAVIILTRKKKAA